MGKNANRQYEMVWAYLDVKVKKALQKLAAAKGVSISEYIRNLILEDLDKRTIFTTILKEEGAEALAANSQGGVNGK